MGRITLGDEMRLILFFFSMTSAWAGMEIFDRFDCDDYLKRIDCLKPFATEKGCEKFLADADFRAQKEREQQNIVQYVMTHLDESQELGLTEIQQNCTDCISLHLAQDSGHAREIWERMNSKALVRKNFSDDELAAERAYLVPRLFNSNQPPCGAVANTGVVKSGGVSFPTYSSAEMSSRYTSNPGLLGEASATLKLSSTDILSVYSANTDRGQQASVFLPVSEIKCGPWGNNISLSSDGQKQGVRASGMMRQFLNDSITMLTDTQYRPLDDISIVANIKARLNVVDQNTEAVNGFLAELVRMKRTGGTLDIERFEQESEKIFEKYLNPQSDLDVSRLLFERIPGRDNVVADSIRSQMNENQNRCHSMMPVICRGRKQVEEGLADSSFGYCLHFTPSSSTPSSSRNPRELGDTQDEMFLDWCAVGDAQHSTEVECVGQKMRELLRMEQVAPTCSCEEHPGLSYMMCYNDLNENDKRYHYVSCPATRGNPWGDTLVQLKCTGALAICCEPSIYAEPQDIDKLNYCRQMLNRAAEEKGVKL